MIGTHPCLIPQWSLNPLKWLGNEAKATLADGFTSMMMAIWSGAMWLLKTAFGLIDTFTPSIEDPGLNNLYGVTVWIAGVIALVLAFGQIGLAVLRQDGRGLGTLVAGVIQYGAVLVCWIAVCAGLISGASDLTKGILEALLAVPDFSGYAAGDGFVDQVSGTTNAAVLGICGLFILIPAAFGHMVIMMVRSAALLILVATMPIAAAGALSEGTKSWMWKSIRWFLACVLMEPLLALVIGMGTQFAWAGLPDNEPTGDFAIFKATATNVGMSVVGSIIMLVACFMPLVLFRLLAFVDPGTASGASFRSTMSANGGVSGLLRGKSAGGGQAAGSGAAAEGSSDGRSSSESGAEADHSHRWKAGSLSQGVVKGLGYPVMHPGKTARAGARGIGRGMDAAGKVAQAGASMGVDVLGAGGIGNQGYYPTHHDHDKPHKPHRQGRQSHQRNQDHQGHTRSGIANEIPPPRQAAEIVEENPELLA